MIRKLEDIDLLKYVKYNYLSKNIKRNNGHKLIPHKHSVISVSKDAQIILDGDLVINDRKIGDSKAEAYLVVNGGKLHIKGNVKLRFGSTVQVNRGAEAEFGSFTCNAGINIQCNKKIVIGEDCMMGRNVVIYDSAYHPTGSSSNRMQISEQPVEIGNHVWIGANSVIMQGTEIGDGAVLGTNVCVAGRIAPSSMVTPKFDQASISGVMWARSMDSQNLQMAEKYFCVANGEDELLNDTVVAKNEEIILQILSDHVSGIDFKNETGLVDERVFDSLTLISVVAWLEDAFNTSIPFTSVNAGNFNSVHNMAKLMTKILNGCENAVSTEKGKEISLELLELDITETDKPVVQRIMEYALKAPGDIAIISNDYQTTYSELASQIWSIASWLMKSGIQPGDCVVVEAVHSGLCIACYYAVHLLGAKLVPTEKNAAKTRILEIAHEIKASMIISMKSYNADIQWKSYGDVECISCLEVFDKKTEVKYPDIDSPCEMVFTTGTTGKSKGVLMTHRHISWYAYSVAKCVEMKKGNRFLITTPLNHAGGLRRTHLSLANGCCVVYMDGLSDLQKYFRYIKDYGVTSLYLPPAAIRILMTRTGKELEKYQEQIDFVYSSSSSLPMGDCMELSKLLPMTRLYNAYEASETPGVSAYDYNVQNALKNCMGKANAGVEICIFTEEGFTTKPDVEGQIAVRSKMNMKEYYMEPELTAEVWNGGWFVSNDLGTMDAEGNIYYKGRRGDVINLGGYKIAPTDVEEMALLSGTVNECVLIEAIDEMKVPYLKLLVVVNNVEEFQTTKLSQFLSERLEAYKVPRTIAIVDHIEKTFNGKINRKAYR